MNCKYPVWLPPDGDTRLVRFQHQAAAALGLVNGVPLPPYLELKHSVPPRGDVRLGGWILAGEPVLEAWDDGGPVGVVRFSFGPGASPGLGALPLPPPWRWNRGVTAVLELTASEAAPRFLLWSWSSRRGWKAAPPRE